MFIQRTAEVSKVSEHSDHNFGNKKRKQKEIDETGNLKFQVLGSLRKVYISNYEPVIQLKKIVNLLRNTLIEV